MIERLIASNLIENPEVSVVVLEIHSPKVSVSGNVRMAGYFELKTPDVTVLDMIAKAQGLNEFADKGSIRVIRRGQHGRDRLQVQRRHQRKEQRQLHRPARRRHHRSMRIPMPREPMSPASDESMLVRTIAILRRRALIAAVDVHRGDCRRGGLRRLSS